MQTMDESSRKLPELYKKDVSLGILFVLTQKVLRRLIV